MSPTESDIFCWGGGLKKVAACGLFAVFLWLCGSYAAAVVAVLLWSPAAAVGLLW